MDAPTISRHEIHRVLIAGDTHGNTAWMEALTRTAAAEGCAVIIQVGDFGYFPNFPDGPGFLADANAACATNGVELWFVDGNHDDHDALAQFRQADTLVRLTDHVAYIPRGARLRLGGVRFGFLGGAFSVDWRDRTTGIDWWPSETTDLSDVARLGDDDLDVLISHDAPTGLDLADRRLPAEDQIRADEVRSLIASAVEATRPQIVFHGHWHRAHDTELSWIDRAETGRTGALTWRSTRIIGLGCDGDIDAGWLLLDLHALGVRLPSTEWPSLGVET